MSDNRTTERVDHSPRVRKAIDELMREKDATDNRTNEMRSLLKERGVGYKPTRFSTLQTTFAANGIEWIVTEREATGELFVEPRHGLTPEQAIAATLGSENCARCAEDMGRYADSLCDPLKERIAELLRCLENDWHISASWDGLRKFWNIGLTEEGVKLRDAELGSEREKRLEKLVRSLYADYYIEWPDRAEEAYAEQMKELGIEVNDDER